VNDVKNKWYLLQSGPCAHDYNMALDEALMECAPHIGAPVLRFYGWTEPAASFGYSQKYSEIERATMLRPLVRRPTGGGLVPHDADWTYSIAFPPEHYWYQLKAIESYRQVHEWISDAFARMKVVTTLSAGTPKSMPGQCFVGSEKFDVLWFGKKIAGAAQRRTKTGLLIQGSIQPPPISLGRMEWQTAMCQSGYENFEADWAALAVEGGLAEKTEQFRASKYSRYSFNKSR
jgi:lipoyl(octanoyl) transferase